MSLAKPCPALGVAALLLQRPRNGPIALLPSPTPTAVPAPGPEGTATSRDVAVRRQHHAKGPPRLTIEEEISFSNQNSSLMQGQEKRGDKMTDSWQASAAGAQQGSGFCSGGLF